MRIECFSSCWPSLYSGRQLDKLRLVWPSQANQAGWLIESMTHCVCDSLKHECRNLKLLVRIPSHCKRMIGWIYELFQNDHSHLWAGSIGMTAVMVHTEHQLWRVKKVRKCCKWYMHFQILILDPGVVPWKSESRVDNLDILFGKNSQPSVWLVQLCKELVVWHNATFLQTWRERYDWCTNYSLRWIA